MDNQLLNKLINEVNSANLLNNTVINSKEFKIFDKVLIEKYKRKNNLFNKYLELISYDDFKILVKDLVVLIMKEYLKNTKFKYDSVSCNIKKYNILGHFCRNTNDITLSETVIKSLYDGNILALEIVFHELYHFVMKYDVLNRNINNMLVKCLKDYLLSSLSLSYCLDNYTVLSYENIVDSKAILELINYINGHSINISKKEKKKINYLLDENIEYFYCNSRIINSFGSYKKYQELFEKYINEHPEWLNYFQISIEYYMDNNGIIIKRNKEQLIELLNIELEKEETNIELIDYLEELINNKSKKMKF